MIARKVRVLALGLVMVLAVGACSSSDDHGTATTTTTISKQASAWAAKWDDKLVTDYAPAQEALLTAIQKATVADVQAAALKVKAANEALGLAIQAAGNPPKSVEPKVTALLEGLSTEHTIVTEILARCTGADPKCQNFVTEYGKNNRDAIVPALDALATRT